MTVESDPAYVITITALSDRVKNLAPVFNFSRAISKLQLIAKNSDPVLIGQSYYFGNGFSTAVRKPLQMSFKWPAHKDVFPGRLSLLSAEILSNEGETTAGKRLCLQATPKRLKIKP